MLNWAQQFNIFCFLDNQQYAIAPHQYECILAAGAQALVQAPAHILQEVDAFIDGRSWLFGHLSYELNHHLYGIEVTKPNPVGFPVFSFFRPQVVVYIKDRDLIIEAPVADKIYQQIMDMPLLPADFTATTVDIQQQFTKEAYIHTVQQLQQHILRGDCYEINFCQSFFAEGVTLNPLAVYQNLVQLSPNPFNALYKLQDQYLICASPERFLKKEGERLISQPIKGTAKRGTTKAEDETFKNRLLQSRKEKAENVMVVDLVRNDLAKVCREGSVQVEELYGIYTFPQVHQMISTISGVLKANSSFSSVIEALFPMGSMTGAPKHRVMQLIEQYEKSGRGLFSGSVGYIAPDGDFDFNVVIRSIMYNAATHYLTYGLGSGITFYSDAEKEWEECLLKGEAIKKVLTS